MGLRDRLGLTSLGEGLALVGLRGLQEALGLGSSVALRAGLAARYCSK